MTKDMRIRILEQQFDDLLESVSKMLTKIDTLDLQMGTVYADVRGVKEELSTQADRTAKLKWESNKLREMLACHEKYEHDLVVSGVNNNGRTAVTYTCKLCGFQIIYAVDELDKDEVAALRQLGLIS